ncbi:MAG: hypothetical protein V3R49_01410 [Gammaproteobacteria bacterium]
MKWIKQSLAPGLASFGVLAYLKGDYEKSVSRIERAFDWVPQLNEMPVYSGYLGLSLLKVGKAIEAQLHLEKSLGGFNKLAFIDKDEKEINAELKKEIENALQVFKT